jgi:hypothetical protein
MRGLDINGVLPFSRLVQVAYGASPYITNVTGVTLNGGTADIVPAAQTRVIPGTIAIA